MNQIQSITAEVRPHLRNPAVAASGSHFLWWPTTCWPGCLHRSLALVIIDQQQRDLPCFGPSGGRAEEVYQLEELLSTEKDVLKALLFHHFYNFQRDIPPTTTQHVQTSPVASPEASSAADGQSIPRDFSPGSCQQCPNCAPLVQPVLTFARS